MSLYCPLLGVASEQQARPPCRLLKLPIQPSSVPWFPHLSNEIIRPTGESCPGDGMGCDPQLVTLLVPSPHGDTGLCLEVHGVVNMAGVGMGLHLVGGGQGVRKNGLARTVPRARTENSCPGDSMGALSPGCHVP